VNGAGPDIEDRGLEAERELSFAEAYSTLLGAQKSARGAPAYSRWVNRPAGRVLAAASYRAGLVPNQVTALSALITYSGIAVLAFVEPGVATALLVGLLLLLGYALDSADGQLARLTRLGSPSGEWLDHVIDMGKICLLHGAVAISWVRWGVPGVDAGAWAVGVPVLFLAVSVVSFFGWLLSDLLIRIGRARRQGQVPSSPGAPISAAPASATTPPAAPALRSVLRLPGDYGLLALTFSWFVAPLFAVTYTLLLAANALILLAALPVWFRQVRAIEGGP
jgi:phosphatidylglycerophosphate synthase